MPNRQRRLRNRLAIGGALAVAVTALLIVVLVVVPALRPASVSDHYQLADLPSEPVPSWHIDTSSEDGYSYGYQVSTISSDRALALEAQDQWGLREDPGENPLADGSAARTAKLYDLREGTELWAISLSELVPEIGAQWDLESIGDGTGSITLLAKPPRLGASDDDGIVITLDLSDGSLLETLAVPARANVFAGPGHIGILSDELRVYSHHDLAGGPLWSAQASGRHAYFVGEYIATLTDIFRLSDGASVSDSIVLDSPVYSRIGDVLLAWSREGEEVQVLDEAAEPLWSSSGQRPYWNGASLFLANPIDGERSGTIIRVEPSSGRPLWDAPVGMDFTEVLLATSNRVIVLDTFGDIHVLDLGSGELVETVAQPHAMQGFWASPNHLYVWLSTGELMAIESETGAVAWTTDFGDAELVPLGNRLMLCEGDLLYALEA